MTKEQANQLRQSIERFGYCELIAVQPDNRIIAGHMRVNLLKGTTSKNAEVEVRVPDRMLTEDEMREYLIRSNKNTGEWDWDVLANDFETIELVEWGFDPQDFLDYAEDDLFSGSEETQEDEKCPECKQKLKKKKNGKKKS